MFFTGYLLYVLGIKDIYKQVYIPIYVYEQCIVDFLFMYLMCWQQSFSQARNGGIRPQSWAHVLRMVWKLAESN